MKIKLQGPLTFASSHQYCNYSALKKHTNSSASSQCRGYRILGLGSQKSVSKAVSDAEKIVGYPTSFLSLRCLLSDEMSNIALHMRKLVGTKHPLLKTARGMVFDGNHNLQMKGLFVMLISKAAGPNPKDSFGEEEMVSGVYPSQRSLAEIMEVIHTANLIHKGVVNLESVLPEHGPVADMEFGNKMAVLSGDYLLASACTGLAKLGHPKVVEEVASSIADMMIAEFTNFTDLDGNAKIPEECKGFSDWLKQTYLSFGSLLAKSCRSAMRLAGHSEQFKAMAFAFGENVSYVQQLSKDIKPFIEYDELSSLNLTSAPILLYKDMVSAKEFEKLEHLWQGGPSNYHKIVTLVLESGVISHCKELLTQYREKAVASLECYSDSEAKSALINMVTAVSTVR
ncbi:decaprenyl-diphosphate synthase subunit 2 [Plakobranchus ocellatus]|uniref:Decaprenyl-diphosphate synthase subunit 2 n=1 Tax=Plakobranchus ocellatus TaxID=259542 RepID=A0AAV4C6L8_9GAST|nr:decaprenyl-diphosphate synthase subunit 2 [Plakobranchus ocellatus]